MPNETERYDPNAKRPRARMNADKNSKGAARRRGGIGAFAKGAWERLPILLFGFAAALMGWGDKRKPPPRFRSGKIVRALVSQLPLIFLRRFGPYIPA